MFCGVKHAAKQAWDRSEIISGAMSGSGAGWRLSSGSSGSNKVADGASCVVVERRFFLTWSMWPLMVAVEIGGFARMVADVRPGKSIRKLRSKAARNVVIEGEKREAWAKFTRAAAVVG